MRRKKENESEEFICPWLKEPKKISIAQCFDCPFVTANGEEGIINIGCKFPKQESELPDVINLIHEEYKRAVSLNPPFNSSHEGYAVIKEELEELWDEIKKEKSQRSKEAMKKEAIQVGAMAVRFILNICNSEDPLR